MRGRGKKINPEKNYVAAKDFAAGKVIGRPKQRWTGTGWEKYVEEPSQGTVLPSAQDSSNLSGDREKTTE